MPDQEYRIGNEILRFPEGTPQAEIDAALAEYTKAAAAPPIANEGNTLTNFMKRVLVPQVSLDETVEMIPTATGAMGGAAGGVLGGFAGGIGAIPGAALGAGLGGAAGESIRQGIQYARGKEGPRSLAGQLKKIGIEGAIQGATDLVGGAAGRYVLEPLGRGIYKAAARPGINLLRQFPDVIQEAMTRRLPVSLGGLEEATAQTVAGREAADALLAKAEAEGARPLNLTKDILRPVARELRPIATLEQKAGVKGARADLAERLRNIREEFKARRPRGSQTGQVSVEDVELTPQAAARPTPITGEGAWMARGEVPTPQAYELAAQASAMPQPVGGLPVGNWRINTRVPVVQEGALGARVRPPSPVPERVVEHPVGNWRVQAPVPEPPSGPLFRDIPVTEGQDIKRTVQDLGETAFRAQERGAVINAPEARFNLAQARAYKQGLESSVPDVAPLNLETQKALSVKRLIEDRLLRGGGIAEDVASGAIAGSAPYLLASGNVPAAVGALATGGAVKAATGPYLLSRAGIAAQDLAPLQPSLYRAVLKLLRDQGIDESALGNIGFTRPTGAITIE